MTKHRVRIYETGPPDILQYESDPTGESMPGPGEVRLRHEAIGVNYVDTMFRDGTFKVPLPFTMGVEGAGIVEAIGPDVGTVDIGDRVAYFFSFGAYTQSRIIPANALLKLPADISTEQAATIMAKGLTAWMLLRRVHPIVRGETALIQGASGAVGSLLTRWAKELGANVIAVVGSPGKADILKRDGIANVLISGQNDFFSAVHAITGGKGVDVVFELVGKASFNDSVTVLKEGGHLVHAGNASGSPAIDERLLSAKAIRHEQPSTPQYVNDRASIEIASLELFDAFRHGVFGKISPVRYPLAEAHRAHQAIKTRSNQGPIILIP